MSNFHAHGDSSIYGAMVFLAQHWKNNLPLIEAWGNIGSIDGDGPCAMRYLETRLSKNTTLLTEDLSFDTVDMVPNFDDTCLEPTVLPSKIPLLLINGSTGIAAGYATDIPPFNLNEIINACIYRLSHKTMSAKDLIKIVPGPDFPTGGYMIGSPEIAMKTGKGKIVNSCSYTIKENKKNNQMVITEIPYETYKQDLVKEIINLNKDFILDVRDESDKDGIKVVIDIDKNIDIKTAVKFILKNTNFMKNYSCNMVAIVEGKPKQVGVIELIESWCDFKKDVVKRKFTYLLKQYENRKEIVEGLIRAYSILDEVIKVIKASTDKGDVIKNLIKNFNFTENQATSIAEMRLYKLCNTDIVALQNELNDINKRINEANKILSSDKEITKHIIKELEKINKEFQTPRKTKIISEEKDYEIDEKKLIQNEEYFIIVTKDGYLKKMQSKKQDEQQFLKEDDEIISSSIKKTHDYINLMTDLGGYLKLSVHKIPECKPSEIGTHISKWVKCDGHKIIKEGSGNMLAWTNDGLIKTFNTDEFIEPTKMIKIPTYFKMRKGHVCSVENITKKDLIVLSETHINLYPISEITETSLSSSGLAACKLKENESLLLVKQVESSDCIKFDKKTFNINKLSYTHRGYTGQKY